MKAVMNLYSYTNACSSELLIVYLENMLYLRWAVLNVGLVRRTGAQNYYMGI